MIVEDTIEQSLPLLEKASFHLFEYRGDKLLYDIHTGGLLELNDFSYKLLQLCGLYSMDDVIAHLKPDHPEIETSDIEDVLDNIRKKGFFRHQKVNIDLQKRNIDGLWRHKPRRLQLFLAQSCNLACQYCYAENNGSNARGLLMRWQVAKAGVDFLVKRSGRRRNLQVTFFGGEPLLNYPVLKRVVAYCDSLQKRTNKKFVFELITNGTLLSKEIADFVAERDFLLFISIDGWREMHNQQRPARNGKDNYETILENAKYVVNRFRELKSRKKVKIRANLTPEFNDVKKVASYLESQGFDKIGIAPIVPLPYCEQVPGCLNEEQMQQFENDINEIFDEAITAYKNHKRVGAYASRLLHRSIINRSKRRITLGIICGICRNTGAVDCDGNVYPCHRYVGMKPYIVGNVFEGMSPARTIGLYNSYNEKALKQCSDCWARHQCAGGCSWEVSPPNGEIYSRPRTMCDKTRKNIEKGLWLDKEVRKHIPEYHKSVQKQIIKNPENDALDQWRW